MKKEQLFPKIFDFFAHEEQEVERKDRTDTGADIGAALCLHG